MIIQKNFVLVFAALSLIFIWLGSGIFLIFCGLLFSLNLP